MRRRFHIDRQGPGVAFSTLTANPAQEDGKSCGMVEKSWSIS
jgi:hypothetical protein